MESELFLRGEKSLKTALIFLFDNILSWLYI
jgi:hypothetical protein